MILSISIKPFKERYNYISREPLLIHLTAHILDQLLEKDYTVVTTVRSEAKAQKIRDAHPGEAADGKLEVVIVPDIAQPGAFDEVAKTPGIDAVLHTASPFHFNISE